MDRWNKERQKMRHMKGKKRQRGREEKRREEKRREEKRREEKRRDRRAAGGQVPVRYTERNPFHLGFVCVCTSKPTSDLPTHAVALPFYSSWFGFVFVESAKIDRKRAMVPKRRCLMPHQSPAFGFN